MFLTEYHRGSRIEPAIDENGDYVVAETETENQSAVEYGVHGTHPFRYLSLRVAEGQVINDGTDTETVTVEVVDGLEVARGTDPANATVLNYDGDVTLSVDGQQATKTVTNGSVSFDLTTDKPAGSEIEIVAESLADHPAESDSATIEVVSL